MPGLARKLDVTALHHFLWTRSDRKNRIVVNQRDLAAQLDVSHDCVSETLIHMTKLGLLETGERLEFGVKRYVVKPPDKVEAKIERKRVVAWG